jgi:hypothetical protein
MSTMPGPVGAVSSLSRYSNRSRGSPIAVLFVLLAIVLLTGSLLGPGPLGWAGPARGGAAIPGFLPASNSSTTYTITFTESGIPVGTTWTIQLWGSSANQTAQSSKATLKVSVPNGTYSYASSFSAWGTSVTGSNGTLKVAGSAVAATVSFAARFVVGFSETGLPSGSTWSVTVSGKSLNQTLQANASTLRFLAPNGTLNYRALASGGYGLTPSSGTVSVSGANASVALTGRALPTYVVTFTESGIAVGTSWAVNLSGPSGQYAQSKGLTLTVSLANGTYGYTSLYDAGGTWIPGSNGTFNVSGQTVAVTVTFTPKFWVGFTESGLPRSVGWGVTVSGNGINTTLNSSPPYYTPTTLGLYVPNGTVTFHASASGGYTLSPASGTVTVNGANASVTLSAYAPPMYSVNFIETGLPSGTTWYVDLGGGPNSSTGSWSVSSAVTFSRSNGTYGFSVGTNYSFAPSPASGSVAVRGGAVNVSIQFSRTYTVLFRESGLGAGTLWGVTISGNSTYYSVGTNLTRALPNGSYPLSFVGVSGYSLSGAPSSLTVSGANRTVSVHYQLLPGHYDVTFTAANVPSGTGWVVVVVRQPPMNVSGVGNSTGAYLSFALVNGTYNWSASASSGSMSPSRGNFTVSGANVSVSLRYVPPPKFAVTFQEWGLPAGSTFTVSLPYNASSNSSTSNGGSPGASVSFSLVNGSYAYSVAQNGNYSPSPGSGTVRVHGANQTINVTFSKATYPVSFSESGLPSGTSWSVTFGGTSASSTGNLTFQVVNGSYPFTVGSVSGYTASPSSGTVKVRGQAQTISVRFTANVTQPLRYSVYFNESGLPNGSTWSVDLNGTTHTSTSFSILFTDPNGSYRFNASCGANYTASPSSGYANVSGTTVAINITCTNASGLVPVGFAPRGLAGNVQWSVMLTARSAGLSIELASSVTRSAGGGSTISFRVSPGDYSYSASASGYQLASGELDVASATPATITISFVPTVPTTSQPNPAERLFTGPAAAVGIGLAAIGALGLALIVRNGRARERERSRLLVEEIARSEWSRDANDQPVLRDRPH